MLLAAKLHLATRDANDDPDKEDRAAKRKLLREFAGSVVGAWRAGTALSDEAVSAKQLIDAISGPAWLDATEALLASTSDENSVKLLSQWRVTSALLKKVAYRERALLLLIEILSFHPWGAGVKFEASVRKDRLVKIAGALRPHVTEADVKDLDKKLSDSLKGFSKKDVAWGKVAAVGVGAAAIGVVSGGLAAPALGGWVGSTFLGLSGAAATSAGLALLGGGSLAAGGMGMAGGAALVATTAGLVGAGAGAGGAALLTDSPREVLSEAAKLDVLSEVVILREKGDVAQLQRWKTTFDQALKARPKESKNKPEPASGSFFDKAKGTAVSALQVLVKQLDAWGILDRLRDALNSRIDDFIAAVEKWSGEISLAQISGAPAGTALVEVRIAESFGRGVKRASYLLPALIVNEDNEPLMAVAVKVLKGEKKSRGRDVSEKIGIKHPLASAAIAAGVDILAHPFTWAAIAAVAVGAAAGGSVGAGGAVELTAGSLIPGVPLVERLGSMGIDPLTLAEAVFKVVDQEFRESAGQIAIDLATGLRLTINPEGG